MKPKLIIKSLKDLLGIVILIEDSDDRDFLSDLLKAYGCRVGWGDGRDFETSNIKNCHKWVIYSKLEDEVYDTPRVFTTDRSHDVSFKNLDFQIISHQADSSMIMNLFQ